MRSGRSRRSVARLARRRGARLGRAACRGCTSQPAADPPRTRTWTTSRKATSRRRRATSSTTARRCAPPVPGTVARGELREDARRSATGKDAAGDLRRRDRRSSRRDDACVARGARALRHLLPALPRPERRRQGHPRSSAASVPTPSFHDDRLRADARRPALRRHHERLGPDAGLPLADPAGRPLGDHRPRAAPAAASARARETAGGEAPGTPPACKIAVAVGRRLVALALAACASGSSRFVLSREYRSPLPRRTRPPQATPRDQGLADEAAAETEGRPREAVRGGRATGRFPVVGSRVAVWVLAQLHLLFAAFVLAVPIFALIIEFIGYRTGDKRYDRAGPRVHQAAVGVVLAHRDLRRVPDLHARCCSTRSSRTT